MHCPLTVCTVSAPNGTLCTCSVHCQCTQQCTLYVQCTLKLPSQLICVGAMYTVCPGNGAQCTCSVHCTRTVHRCCSLLVPAMVHSKCAYYALSARMAALCTCTVRQRCTLHRFMGACIYSIHYKCTQRSTAFLVYTVSGNNSAVGTYVDSPKCAICAPVVQISLQQCILHVDCISSHNLDALCTPIFCTMP